MLVDYKSRKRDVLASYETLEVLIKEIKDYALTVGMSDPLESVESLLSHIRIRAEKVRADRFCLMVAGESKSGKSTFINAYLGVELMPMDVKQCTIAIVEIKSGSEFCIRATYADDKVQEIKGDDDAAREFLKKNAALDDEYRNIPVPTINNEILVKSGLRAKANNSTIIISEHEVEDLLNASAFQEANIHNLPIDEYNQRVREYIEKKKDDWQSIVTKIEVLFPLAEEMQGIEIIDSPGVYARGGVSDITTQYIENADAIIFLKPVSGQALESNQFNQFLGNASVEQNKNALFLVLTRATNVTAAELRRLEAEAYKQFSNLDKRNILLVDSKAELYAKKLSAVDDIEAELRRLNQTGTLDDFVMAAWSDTSGLFGNNDKGDFIKALQEKSRFSQIYDSLEIFGRKAHYILFADLLDYICRLYLKLWNNLIVDMNLFRQKAEDPTELAKKIAKVKRDLDEINNKILKGVGEVVRRFCGDEGIIKKTADAAVEDFKSKISSIDPHSSDKFNELERHSIHKIDEFKKLMETLQNDVVAEFDVKLIELSDKSTIPFESLKPDFTETTFRNIWESTKPEAAVLRTYEEGTTFKKTHTYSAYSRDKHYDIIKVNIMSRLGTIKNDLIGIVGNFTEKILDRYIVELSKNAADKKKELDAIMEAKATAEQIKEIIEKLSELTKKIETAKGEAAKIKGGIDQNV
jgi:tetrahydromethanopterin S-methyltransferase subunit G